jgi:hypothetical protein
MSQNQAGDECKVSHPVHSGHPGRIGREKRGIRWLAVIFGLIAVLVAGCGGSTTGNNSGHNTAPLNATPPSTSDVNGVVVAMLQNIKQNGWNSNPNINNGLGGLWVNWEYGSNPLKTNGGDPSKQNSHDRLTDLRYLHNLLSYQAENPTDTQFASEIQKYTQIVKMEFADGTDQRGWIYDEWWDMYQLSHDDWFKTAAYNEANNYYTNWYHPSVGALYQVTNSEPNGYYRTEDTMGMGAALIEAGVQFNNPNWVNAGKTALAFLRSHAYVPQYHMYLHLLDNVVSSSGAANQNESIQKVDVQQSDGSTTTHDGDVVKAESIGTEAIALMEAYIASQDKQYLDQAVDMLTYMQANTNLTGMWDTTYGGYFYGVVFSGTDTGSLGSPHVKATEKEAGRQMLMLRAYHMANMLTNGQFQGMENLLLQVAVTKAYYAPGHGVLYSVQQNWQPHKRKGQPLDYVTTEAMGIMLEALLSLHAPNAQIAG